LVVENRQAGDIENIPKKFTFADFFPVKSLELRKAIDSKERDYVCCDNQDFCIFVREKEEGREEKHFHESINIIEVI